jgi:hypothetical protein
VGNRSRLSERRHCLRAAIAEGRDCRLSINSPLCGWRAYNPAVPIEVFEGAFSPKVARLRTAPAAR